MRDDIISGKTRFSMTVVEPIEVLNELADEGLLIGPCKAGDERFLKREFRVVCEPIDKGQKSTHLSFLDEAECDAAMDCIRLNCEVWESLNKDDGEPECPVGAIDDDVAP